MNTIVDTSSDTGDVDDPSKITGLYKFVVPAKTGDSPGIYDSIDSEKIPSHVSSFFIDSISGADTIDMQIMRAGVVAGDIPSLNALDSFGSELWNRNGGFDRFIFSNNAATEVTVKIRLNRRGTFRKIATGGGGGVATHVSIDGVANIAGDVGIKDGAKVKVDGIVFPDSMAVSGDVGLKDGAKVKVDGIVFPDSMAVSGDVGLKDGAKVKVDGIVFPTSMAVSGDVGLKDGAKVTISGTPAVTLASGTITVNPVASPSLCAGGRPIVNKAMAKLISARPKRHSVLIQADASNTNDLWICDASAEHVLCAIIQPGCSFGLDYSGELWAQAATDGQKCYITDLYNP
ncbi:hypothetical protein BJAS_P3406 [Bathymodiolus japonicus methanotrophic gill symbiont]|uniref:hypothetical protein n=1 Tax=Bathymodiolus japonicus methanotrophic gill symbiont TaxID=113269 RepID=UPI001B69DC1B|nr:hypothetical protein [Bathymodiolus japonicus methanotrophic gill symbiont]GFO72870.1 hypothetical protein BJAS_P3406 [Bathymodiolus japonicus methanotrophic gill symbiont]